MSKKEEPDEKRVRYDYVICELNKTEQQFLSEEETDGKVQYQQRDYWISNLTNDELQIVKRGTMNTILRLRMNLATI